MFFYVAYGAMIQMIVAALPTTWQANSLVHGSRAFSYVVGNTSAVLLVAPPAGPYALAVDAVSYLWSALFLGRMRIDEPPGAPPETGGLMAGARWIRDNAIIRAELLGVATLNLFNFMFFALFVLYATRSLHVGPATLGLVLGAAAVGTLAGSFVTARIGRRFGTGARSRSAASSFPRR